MENSAAIIEALQKVISLIEPSVQVVESSTPTVKSEPSAPVVNLTEVPSVVEVTSSMSKDSKAAAKAAKSEANKALNRKINAALAVATKSAKADDLDKVVSSIQKALKMTPAHWDSTILRIVKKADSLGVTVS